MFEKADCRIRWNNDMSEVIKSDYGVLQGGKLSPKLFTEYLHDIGQYLDNSNGVVLGESLLFYLLFADDLVLFSDTAEGLQSQLDGLFTFCKKWHMLLNFSKTRLLVFNKRNVEGKFYYNGYEVERSEKYKYLGVWFNTTKHDYLATSKDYLVEQANKALYQAYKLSGPIVGRLSPPIAFKVFDTQVMPILEYGSDIWFCKKSVHKIETFYLKFLKSTLGVRTQTTNDAVYAETGRVPINIRLQVKALKYWLRILKLPDEHLVKQAYNTLRYLDSLGQLNWC